MKKFKLFKLLALFVVLITSIPQMRANSYWYRGGKNSWGSSSPTAMTVSTDTYYEYCEGNYDGDHRFKICVNSSNYTDAFGASKISNGFNGTNVDIDDPNDNDNAKINRTGDGQYYYILVYYPNTAMNRTENPILCASTSLPNNSGSITAYFAKPDFWKSTINAYEWFPGGDANKTWPGVEIATPTGDTYDGLPIYSYTTSPKYNLLIFNGKKNDDNSDQTSDMTLFNNFTNNAGRMVRLNNTTWEWVDYVKDHVIKSGSTLVWDLGNEEDSYWPNVYVYRMHYLADPDHDAMTKMANNQSYITYAEDTYCKEFLFRNANGSTWDDFRSTTNIPGSNCDDQTGITLYTYPNTTTGIQLDWQVTYNAKKGTNGIKVYFDNTNTNWAAIYFKYGTDWFNRSIAYTMTKVTGTANLYVLELPHDVYYKEYFLSAEAGTNANGYENIETATGITKRTVFQASNLAADVTIIPATGSGTPAVSTVSTISGHERQVSITAPSHGTITVAYTNESGTAQSPTSGNFNVAQTCSLTVSSSAATGYNPATLTINGGAHTSGSTYIIRDNITVAATFTPKQCTVTFDLNGGTGGDASVTATYDADMTTVAIPHKIGYKFDGYYDGETADDGSGTKYYNADGTSAKAWDVNTEIGQTLHAKWVADNKTFNGGGSDSKWTTAANWSGSAVPSDDYSSVTINAEVELSSSVHIGQLSFGESGKLIIQPTGALEVEGTIDSDDADKIVINSNGSSQGALIFKSEGSEAKATVIMTMNAASGKFQFIAIPVSYVSVSEKFPGSTVYTYVWSNSAHKWERRGYYDGISAFEAVLLKGQGSAQFKGDLVSTGDISHAGLTYTAADYGYVYMYGNSWTAPITMSAEICTNASISIMNGTSNGWDGVSVGDVIPALQAFGVAVGSGGGSVSIEYNRDVRGASTPNEPLKAPKRQAADTQPIAIYVSGNEMQTRIRLFEDATRFSDDFDNGWDVFYMEGQGYAGEMYALGPESKMNILATSDLEGTVVGFVPGQAENYTISFAGDGKGYYLNDIKMEEATLIDEGNTYEFTPDEKTNATRFVISKTPIKKTPTSVENIGDGVKARKQMINGALYIIRDGRIYNAEGSLVK